MLSKSYIPAAFLPKYDFALAKCKDEVEAGTILMILQCA